MCWPLSHSNFVTTYFASVLSIEKEWLVGLADGKMSGGERMK